MTHNDLVIQRPVGQARQLILLFHGVGSNPQSVRGLGERLASEFPNAAVIAPRAPHPTGNPNGFQWFNVLGVTEANRLERVAGALPGFVDQIQEWQRETGVAASATALVGFSQGAIMSLEAAKLPNACAGRIVSIGGRFASLPVNALADTTIHFLHGKEDVVIPYSNTVLAAHHLRELGCDITAEVLPFIGHEIHPELIDLVVMKLTTHIPNRIWAKALEAVPADR
jgi:phospholipase/carboxylesterase